MSRSRANRSNRRKGDAIEPLAYRVACLILGIAFMAVPFLTRNDPALQDRLWLAALLVMMAALGAIAFLFAIYASDRLVSSFIDSIADFEACAILFIVATLIAWLLRKARRS